MRLTEEQGKHVTPALLLCQTQLDPVSDNPAMRLLHVKKGLLSLFIFAIFYTIADFFFLHIKHFISQQKVSLGRNSSVINSSATVHREKKADSGGRPKTVLLWTPWWDRKAGRNWFLNTTGRFVLSFTELHKPKTSYRDKFQDHKYEERKNYTKKF